MMRYKAWRSRSDPLLHVICGEGAEAFDALPVRIQHLGPWSGSKEGEVKDLRLPYRVLLSEQSFVIVQCHVSKLSLEPGKFDPLRTAAAQTAMVVATSRCTAGSDRKTAGGVEGGDGYHTVAERARPFMAHHGHFGTVIVLPSRRTQFPSYPTLSMVVDRSAICATSSGCWGVVRALLGKRDHHDRRRIGCVCVRPCCLRLLRWFGAMGGSVVIV